MTVKRYCASEKILFKGTVSGKLTILDSTCYIIYTDIREKNYLLHYIYYEEDEEEMKAGIVLEFYHTQVDD
ncbi:hypothetical protein ACF0H5_005080 [Mactra antiquata]